MAVTIQRQETDADGHVWLYTYEVEERETGVLDPDGHPIVEIVETPVARQTVTESASFAASREATRTAAAALIAKQQNHAQRLEALGRRAMRYFKDPVTNAADDFWPTVTGTGAVAGKRAVCELLGRLVLSALADDV